MPKQSFADIKKNSHNFSSNFVVVYFFIMVVYNLNQHKLNSSRLQG